ncbi:MAG: aromatic ring-hydroxylating dioxygenase subunit alpha [Myxococcales bacterium]|nr:aromatic ring-hydroxylating dioxygenase subunit alpha [Myxococcales bacterium]
MSPFVGFARQWTPVALSSELRGRPLAVTVAATDVVLFRDAKGVASALIDRCPHRSVKLSLGRVEDGCLTCPFHGWKFAGDGACTDVPWHPEAKRDALGATPLPTRELGGMLWIYTAIDEQPRDEPSPPAEVLAPDVRLFGESFEWRAHWTRAVENMVDDSHLPFVHPNSIGRGMRRSRDATLALDVEEHPWGWSWRAVVDGVAAEWSAELRLPNVSLLRIPAGPGKSLGICFAAVPVDGERARILQLGYRSFLRSPAFDWIFRAINRRVLGEDKAIVESSPVGPVPHASAEASVATDVVGLRFRKRALAIIRS